MSERYDDNATTGKITSAAGKAAQYAEYMSGAGLEKWKERIAKRRRPAPGWKTIEYDKDGHVVGEREGYDKRASLDVRYAGSERAAYREEYERNNRPEQPLWMDP